MLQVLSCDWQQCHQEPQRGAWWYWHDVQSVQWNCWSALKGMIPVPVRSAACVAQSVTSASIPLNAGCCALYRNYVKANNSSYAIIWCSCWTGKLVLAHTCLFFYFMPARPFWIRYRTPEKRGFGQLAIHFRLPWYHALKLCKSKCANELQTCPCAGLTLYLHKITTIQSQAMYLSTTIQTTITRHTLYLQILQTTKLLMSVHHRLHQ